MHELADQDATTMRKAQEVTRAHDAAKAESGWPMHAGQGRGAGPDRVANRTWKCPNAVAKAGKCLTSPRPATTRSGRSS